MRCMKRQKTAIFQTDRRGRLKYSREDWTGVELPREPSLRLGEDEFFFERVVDVNPVEETPEKQDRFLEFAATTGRETALSEKYQFHVLSQQDSKASKKKRKKKKQKPVPISVRRIEIELTQRRLPRQASQKHLSKPSFYPLKSCDLFEWPPAEPELEEEDPVVEVIDDNLKSIETSGKKSVSFSQPMDEEKSTSTTEIGTEYLETESEIYGSARELQVEIIDEDNTSAAYIDEDEYDEDDESYYDESYYSDSEVLSEDEVSMELENIFEEFLEMQRIHLQNVPKEEPESEPEFEEMIEKYNRSLSTIADESDEDSTNHTREPPTKQKQSTAIGFVTKFLPETSYESEDGTYSREVGFVSPLVRMMIFQARMELRCRKVTEEHKEEYQPTLAEAILLARSTKLDEHVIETQGKNKVKYDDAVIPSVVWVKGKETVKLPNFAGPTPQQFLIFKEAVALGGIKALKPEITTNYDPLESIKNCYDDDMLDVDDVNHHKVIRTKYLTDMYLEEWRAQSDNDEDEESIEYDNLDDVTLPTKDCPEYEIVQAKLEEQELKDLIARQVAEAVWERRYRLERPRAKQRIKYRCTCKYCKTSSTYQTFAYRKRWLIQKNLWCEPNAHDPAHEIIEVPLTDDQNEDTEEKKASFRTKSTADLSIEELSRTLSQDFSAEPGCYDMDNELPDSISVSTTSSEFLREEKSASCTVIPALSMSEGKQEKAEKEKTFMNRSSLNGIRSIFQ